MPGSCVLIVIAIFALQVASTILMILLTVLLYLQKSFGPRLLIQYSQRLATRSVAD